MKILITTIIAMAVAASVFSQTDRAGKRKSPKAKTSSGEKSKKKPPRSSASTKKSTPARSTVPANAQLTIRSTPSNSLILIDGDSVGTTGDDGSLILPSLKAGAYTVTASNTGYRSASKKIILSAGLKETLTFKLERGTQSLNIVSSPPESEVYVDDILRGRTDTSGKARFTDIAIGEYRVTIRKPRYRDAVFPVNLSSDKEGQINANLELALGFLTVSTNAPNPRIDISGRGPVQTPVTKLPVEPGTYSVTVSSPSYVTSRQEVIVTAGQEAELSVDLAADTRARSEPTVDPENSKPVTETRTALANYAVPSGVVINGILQNEINTKTAQNYDRFIITVRSPDEFRGATIQGYISGVGRSGKVSGQSSVTLNFARVTLRNGQTYDFAGNLQSIRDQKGKTVKVDNEGTVKGSSRTQKVVKRGGIGAGIGAILGGVIGGAAGAAIGAAAGGAAGAGSVAMQGGEDVKLKKGSTISLQSSSPIRQ